MQRIKIKDIIFSYRVTGSVSKTAQELGVSRWTVQRLIKRARTGYGTFSTRNLKRGSTRPHLIFTKLKGQEKVDILNLANITHLGARKLKLLLNLDSSSNHPQIPQAKQHDQ